MNVVTDFLRKMIILGNKCYYTLGSYFYSLTPIQVPLLVLWWVHH